MEHREWIEACLAKAAKKYDGAEIYYNRSQLQSWCMNLDGLDSPGLDEELGAELVVHQGDFWAQAYTEKLDKEGMEYLLRQVDEIINLIPRHPDRRLYQQEGGRKTEGMVASPELSVDAYLDFLAILTQETRSLCERTKGIDRIQNIQAHFRRKEEEIQLMNTRGLDCQVSGYFEALDLMVLLQQNEEIQGKGSYRLQPKLGGTDRERMDQEMDLRMDPRKNLRMDLRKNLRMDQEIAKVMAKEAVEKTMACFGAKPVPTGDYLVVLDAPAWGSFLYAGVCGYLSGEAVLNHTSLLAGRQGQQIASALLTSYDDPANPKMPIPRTFDDEGVPTKKKALIEKGVLREYLQTIASARQFSGAQPGNACRSYQSGTHPDIRFLTMEPGEFDQKALLEEAGYGLYVTSLEALQTGMNWVSGDFSLKAKGFQIVDGQIGPPVDQITIAGNLFEVLHNLEAVGSDLVLTRSLQYLPSVFIGPLAVTGI